MVVAERVAASARPQPLERHFEAFHSALHPLELVSLRAGRALNFENRRLFLCPDLPPPLEGPFEVFPTAVRAGGAAAGAAVRTLALGGVVLRRLTRTGEAGGLRVWHHHGALRSRLRGDGEV